MVDLRNCELLEMVQYSCRLDRGPGREAMISCKPIMRLFRRWATAFDLLYNLYIMKVLTNMTLIEYSGAKMSLSWKQLLSKEKGIDDRGMQVCRRYSHLRLCHILPKLNFIGSSKSAISSKFSD